MLKGTLYCENQQQSVSLKSAHHPKTVLKRTVYIENQQQKVPMCGTQLPCAVDVFAGAGIFIQTMVFIMIIMLQEITVVLLNEPGERGLLVAWVRTV